MYIEILTNNHEQSVPHSTSSLTEDSDMFIAFIDDNKRRRELNIQMFRDDVVWKIRSPADPANWAGVGVGNGLKRV